MVGFRRALGWIVSVVLLTTMWAGPTPIIADARAEVGPLEAVLGVSLITSVTPGPGINVGQSWDSWTSTASVTVTITAWSGSTGSTAATITYSLRGPDASSSADVTTTSSPARVQVTAEGISAIRCSCSDEETSSQETTVFVQIDRHPPTTAVTPADLAVSVDSTSVSLDASDSLEASPCLKTRYQLELPDGSYATTNAVAYAGQFVVSVPGTNTVHYCSADAAGNEEPTLTARIRIRAQTKITISLDGGPAKVDNGSSVKLKGKVTLARLAANAPKGLGLVVTARYKGSHPATSWGTSTDASGVFHVRTGALKWSISSFIVRLANSGPYVTPVKDATCPGPGVYVAQGISYKNVRVKGGSTESKAMWLARSTGLLAGRLVKLVGDTSPDKYVSGRSTRVTWTIYEQGRPNNKSGPTGAPLYPKSQWAIQFTPSRSQVGRNWILRVECPGGLDNLPSTAYYVFRISR